MRETPRLCRGALQLKENVSLDAVYPNQMLIVIRHRHPARAIQVNLGGRFANTVWFDFLERGPIVELSSAGLGSFIAASSVCVYIQKNDITTSAPQTSSI